MTIYHHQMAWHIINFFKTAQGLPATEERILRWFSDNGIFAKNPTYSVGSAIYVVAILVRYGLLYEKPAYAVGGTIHPAKYFLSIRGWEFESLEKTIREERVKQELLDKQVHSY